ncbi:hypothetical protein KC19_1G227800 [Ceratodon purpureus]|uniref:Uncharacterized protein n=1 Tax=Ceratodon purpureus TaxID=3225 RepID=A0A8T0JAY9_CERPU|nr:hypothetical protein KC19_1G227800 [Ceratodon purpureus]
MAEIKIRVPPSSFASEEYPGAAPESKPGRYSAFISSLRPNTTLVQKVVAEVISTFILVFTGCGAAMVNTISDGKVTPVGISLVFGLVVTIMIYAVGHISGAHMNPAVTLAFAVARHFPWTQVPLYIGAQCGGSIMASFTLRWILHPAASEGATLPAGSDVQSFLLEIVITFILMFVVAAVATDTRACGELAGIAVGSAVALNALMAGPISGASMNPARSLGPAVASGNYRAIWVYITGPIIGSVLGMMAYNSIRLPDTGVQSDRPAKSFRR